MFDGIAELAGTAAQGQMSELAMLGAGGASIAIFTTAAIFLLIFGYFFIFWERRSDDSPERNDQQALLKLVLFSIMLVGLGLAMGGLTMILGYLLSGAKGGSGIIKQGIASLIAGGGGAAAVFFLFLPRTNFREHQTAEKYALALVAVAAGISTVLDLNGVLSGLFMSAGWPSTAGELAGLLVNGAVLFVALTRFGQLSGWTAPVKPMPMAPPGGGFPPQGYPPQGPPPGQYPGGPGGYPPQGGMPPQGGGFPPPQGGGGLPPPQGGGYPPQGGGGFPPPGGGGYPPR